MGRILLHLQYKVGISILETTTEYFSVVVPILVMIMTRVGMVAGQAGVPIRCPEHATVASQSALALKKRHKRQSRYE